MKTLHNSNASGATKNVKDIIFWGNGDTFKLISKASSKSEGWMKSTKAMEIVGVGCVVQVTTQQLNDTGIKLIGQNENIMHSVVAEALTFVPMAKIEETLDDEGNCISRELILAPKEWI